MKILEWLNKIITNITSWWWYMIFLFYQWFVWRPNILFVYSVFIDFFAWSISPGRNGHHTGTQMVPRSPFLKEWSVFEQIFLLFEQIFWVLESYPVVISLSLLTQTYKLSSFSRQVNRVIGRVCLYWGAQNHYNKYIFAFIFSSKYENLLSTKYEKVLSTKYAQKFPGVK